MTAPPPPSPPAERAGTAAALAFLYQRTARNRFRRQMARVREPRYLAAVVIGALYLWWALVRNSAFRENPFFSTPQVGGIILALAAVGVYAVAARWWLVGTDKGTLAFSPAEVQFLFPAPVTRRALIHAKLLRLQLVILLNTLIFSIILRGGAGTAEGWRRGVALWVVFSTLALHRLGVAIVRASVLEEGSARRRRTARLSLAVFGAATGALVGAILWQWPVLRAAAAVDLGDLFKQIPVALAHPLAAVPLALPRALMAPVFATTLGSWLLTLPWALGILAAHYAWILRLDSRFEEAAIEASQHRAAVLQQLRAGQLRLPRSGSRKVSRMPALGLRGLPEVAIAWKNVAAAVRAGAWKAQLLIQVVLLGVLTVALRLEGGRADGALMGVTAGVGAMLLFTGPLGTRFDLRQDLQRLAILKAWPLPGWRIVAAEIAGVTLLQTVAIGTLLVVPVVQLLTTPQLAERAPQIVPWLVAVLLLLPPVNALLFTIQNGVALYFPAWVRLGTGERGFEAMGQGILTAGASLLVVLVAFVFPGAAALITYLLTGGLGAWRPAAAAVAAALVLLLQLAPAIAALGTRLEATEVTEVPESSSS